MATTATAAPVRRRWRLLIACAIILAAAPVAFWWYMTWAEERDFRAAVAETDRLDPGWRLDDILAARPPIPDDRNAALQVEKVREAGAGGGMFNRKKEEEILERPPNVQLNVPQAEALREFFADKAKARAEALKLKDLPDGRPRITYDPDWLNNPLNWVQHVREIAWFISLDLQLRAHEGTPLEVAGMCRAAINDARSIGDELTLVGILVRVACMEIALWSLERAMAQTEELPAEELRVLQDLLQREIGEPRLWWALRGERAGGLKILEAMRAGRVKRSTLLATKGGWRSWLADWVPGAVTIDRAAYLRATNEMVEASKLAVERHLDEVERIIARWETHDAALAALAGGWNKITQANARNHARLRCALTALAAERYRQKHGHWPTDLAALAQGGFVKAVPLDPYDGQPLRYKRLADGVLVYSVGPDRTDNGGLVDPQNPIGPGTDLGFRLWDLAARRRPPPAPEEQAP
jgi:hypothetical protein